MLALVLIAFGVAAADRRDVAKQNGENGRFGIRGAMFGLGVLATCCAVCLNTAVETRDAIAMVKRSAPPHPSVVAITADPAIGFPLVRAVGGRWISGCWGLWITGNVATQRLGGGLDERRRERFAAYVAAERQRLIADIRDRKPDIILIDNRGPRWSEGVDGDRDLSTLIAANYREIGTADEIAILKRNGT